MINQNKSNKKTWGMQSWQQMIKKKVIIFLLIPEKLVLTKKHFLDVCVNDRKILG